MDKKQVLEELRQAMKAGAHILERLEAEIAEAEKPVLRNWECGINEGQKWLKVDNKVYWIHDREGIDPAGPSDCPETLFAKYPHINVLDVLDDLNARSEPLTEFQLSQTYISGGLDGDHIRLTDRGETSYLLPVKVRELVSYLQRLLVTQEREKKKTRG